MGMKPRRSSSATFWHVVEASRAAWDPNAPDHVERGNQATQVRAFEAALAALGADELLALGREFSRHFWRAYRWDLWAAAYVIEGGCSDDGFMDFRYWLISMGEVAYNLALSDVRSLAATAFQPGVEHTGFEDFGYVLDRVYRERSGRAMPSFPEFHRDEPEGKRFEEDDLERRFPALWAAANPPEEPDPPSLERSSRDGDTKAVAEFLVSGANPQPGLWAASSAGRVEIAQTLLRAGADVNGCDAFGRTALHLASARGHREVIELLRSSGADLDAKTNNGRTALLCVIANISDDVRSDLVGVLTQAGANPDIADNDGCTPLIFAAADGLIEAVKTLIAAGANLECVDEEGETALAVALGNDESEVVALLRGAGARG